MTRAIDAANYNALVAAPEEGGTYRNLVTIFPLNVDGSPAVSVSLWNGAGDYSILVVDPKTGTGVARTFIGDGSVLAVEDIVYSQGVVIKTYRVSLSALHTTVRNLYRGQTIRNCRIELHKAQFVDGDLVGPALVMGVGTIDKAPETLQGIGSDSTIDIDVASRSRVLTVSRPDKKSDEYMKAHRSGDRLRKYNDTANVRIWWGKEKSKAAQGGNSNKSPGGGRNYTQNEIVSPQK